MIDSAAKFVLLYVNIQLIGHVQSLAIGSHQLVHPGGYIILQRSVKRCQIRNEIKNRKGNRYLQSVNLLCALIELKPVGGLQRRTLQIQTQLQVSRVTVLGIAERIRWYDVAQRFTSGHRYLLQSPIARRREVVNTVLYVLRNSDRFDGGGRGGSGGGCCC